MSGPIQALAPAFLNLLGLKNKGALPPDLAEVVQPQIEMLPFYLQGGALGRLDIINPPAPVVAFQGGALTNTTVPANEWWYVHSLTARLFWVALSTSDIIELCAAAVMPVPGTILLGDQAPRKLGAELGGFEWSAPSLRDFWAPPGTRLGLYASYISIVDATPVQTWSCQTSVRYTPIQA